MRFRSRDGCCQGDTGELGLEIIRDLHRGFAEHGVVPEKSIATQPITGELLDGYTFD
jgi:hypothetical protein